MSKDTRTKAELLEAAEAAGIDVPAKANKAQIVELLEAGPTAGVEAVPTGEGAKVIPPGSIDPVLVAKRQARLKAGAGDRIPAKVGKPTTAGLDPRLVEKRKARLDRAASEQTARTSIAR